MHVSRPLLGLLVGTVLFFALWLVALKPSSPTGPGGGGLGQYQSATDKAHAAVALSNATNVAHGGSVGAAAPKASTPVVKPVAVLAPATHPTVRPAPKATGAKSAPRSRGVTHALRSGQVLALLFYNGAAADDRAVKRELAAVPEHGHRVFTLAIPISELSRYAGVTNQVQVTTSPTLVIIDRRHEAMTITGFADRFEIAQRVADALAVK